MDIDTIIERLRKGETIKCEECNNGYYKTSAKDVKKSCDFSCSNCGSVVRISPPITVE